MYTQLCCVYTNVTCKPKRRHSKNERQNETENKDRKSEPSDSRLQSQRFCIFIFSTAHFLKTILASRTNGTFGFARHASRPFAKPKEPFFANARQNRLNTINKM